MPCAFRPCGSLHMQWLTAFDTCSGAAFVAVFFYSTCLMYIYCIYYSCLRQLQIAHSAIQEVFVVFFHWRKWCSFTSCPSNDYDLNLWSSLRTFFLFFFLYVNFQATGTLGGNITFFGRKKSYLSNELWNWCLLTSHPFLYAQSEWMIAKAKVN